MKRIISASAVILLMSTTHLAAQEQDDDLGINVGALSIKNENSINMSNPTVGLTYKINGLSDFKVKPRVDFDYVKVDDDPSVHGFIKGSINAVYEVYDKKNTTPYVVAGVGYEHVNNADSGRLDSHPFAQAGVGISHKSKKGYKLNAEGKVLQILGAPGQDNEVILTGGISIPVGNSCPIKISGPDQDRDGVLDSIDQCPDTPCYFAVDQYGCPVKATLRIHFNVDKYTIRAVSLPKVENFAKYLVTNTDTTVKVIGHTDSDGSDRYNMNLGSNRAKSVMNKLIELGVSAARLTYDSRGEREPVASNRTKHGKALNRRIEVQLSYPNRKGN